jgi:hypothetical protein
MGGRKMYRVLLHSRIRHGRHQYHSSLFLLYTDMLLRTKIHMVNSDSRANMLFRRVTCIKHRRKPHRFPAVFRHCLRKADNICSPTECRCSMGSLTVCRRRDRPVIFIMHRRRIGMCIERRQGLEDRSSLLVPSRRCHHYLFNLTAAWCRPMN